MNKVVVYGSHLCNGCIRMKAYFADKNIEYAFHDISLDFQALRDFLKIRDNNSLYDHIRQEGRVGLPTIIIGDDMIIGFDEEEVSRFKELNN